ncbi:MAG TPA: hypothetical protein VNH11_03625 [Pirellulales bacterium]|nr:hypothetical protein [Pirellulales bacterium]
MNPLAKPLANRPSLLRQSVGYALTAGLIVLSLCGCAGKQPKQPTTVKEFLSQPRPE